MIRPSSLLTIIFILGLSFSAYADTSDQLFVDQGLVQFRHDRVDNALFHFQRAINQNPKNIEAFYNRGMLYLSMGQNQRALVDFEKTLKIQPNFALGHLGKGMALFKKGLLEQSAHAFDEVLRLDPNLALAHYHRALVYFHLNCYQESWDDLNQAKSSGVGVDEEFMTYVEKFRSPKKFRFPELLRKKKSPLPPSST